MAWGPESAQFRFTVLGFTCLLTFGSYFCFDMPSVLQSAFTGSTACNQSLPPKLHSIQAWQRQQQPNISGSCCWDCLGMSEESYNLLYAVYAWTNAVVVFFSGFLVDKLGNRIGVLAFSLLCLIGSATFAAATLLRNTAYLLPVMLLGRLLFGAGNGSLTVVQNRLVAFWFNRRELALAFGCVLAFSRCGSVLNFFLTENIRDAIGLDWTLWFGVGLCVLGFLSAGIVSGLDAYGVRTLGMTDVLRQESRSVKLSDLKQLSLPFWLLVFTIMFYYNGVFPFVADASKFINDKYSYGDKVSAYITGAVYDVSMLLSPFLGGLIDIIGKRGYLALACALLTIPVFGLLAFTLVHPLVSTIWLGVTYSFAAASMWPSLPLVVPRATLGTALGITTSVQMIGIGASNVVVGQILGHDTPVPLKNWTLVMLYLLANVIAAVFVTAVLNAVDLKMGRQLNQSRREKLTHERMAQLEEDGIAHASIESAASASVAAAAASPGFAGATPTGVGFAPAEAAAHQRKGAAAAAYREDERSPLLGGSPGGRKHAIN